MPTGHNDDVRFDLHHTLARVQRLIDRLVPEPVEKTLWGSPAGKKRIAKRLAAMLPPHKTYVEPFAGSGAVLFAKQPAAVEAINDADPEIAEAFRLVKALTPEKIARLKKLTWTGDEKTYKKLRDTKPTGEIEKLHRFLYVTHFSYGKMRGKSFSPSSAGIEAKTIGRLEVHSPRLAKVHVYSGDYEPVVKKYDSKSTALFLDPPYAGYDAAVGEKKFDEHRFVKMLKGIKGKFLMTYGIRGELPRLVKEAGFNVRRIRTPRTIRSMRGVGGSSILTQLLVSNYDIAQKALSPAHDDVAIEDWDASETFRIETKLLKAEEATDEERYVLGIVLEPEVVDSQGDIYSAEEIRQAAHRFMQEFQGLGLQHETRVNDQVKVLESYLLPEDSDISGTEVNKGTWLLGLRILDDGIWQQVKSGGLSGLSIGGSARRVPEGEPAPAKES